MTEERTTAGWKRIKKEECPHISDLKEELISDAEGCAARLPDGQVCGGKEDLRICLTCGTVHCCESHLSHNTEHFKATDHPFIKPYKSDYSFLWCYKCSAFLD